MKKTEYTLAKPDERDAVIDFINYVYSNEYQPHDFKRMFPGIYGDHLTELKAKHFIARQDNSIRALVATRSHRWHVLDDVLTVGTLGNVAVHPYSRGEGHMKHLMADALADSKAMGCDMVILHGKRQRYNYFGFEQAGWAYRYEFTPDSVRHALREVDSGGVTFSELKNGSDKGVDYAYKLHEANNVRAESLRDEFLDTMRIMGQPLYLICINGKMAGYIVKGRELVLETENDLLCVIKALFEREGISYLNIKTPPWQSKRIAMLAPVCSGRSIETSVMINVINWCKVIETLLRLKASFAPVANGVLTMEIDGEKITICVENGEINVLPSQRQADVSMSHLEAQRALFGIESFAIGGLYADWFPLPFYVLPADEF